MQGLEFQLGETADEVIKRLVSGYATEAEVKVISRDWELKDAARQAGQTSGNIKRRESLNKARQQSAAKDDDGGWNNSTKKRGPAKRTPKNSRKKGPGDDVYW